ncbi:MAG: metallophosphoesterase [Paludibacteraceae bacterium]|nr:metallophosphoesterase [Paludibacteraceae bacterium]
MNHLNLNSEYLFCVGDIHGEYGGLSVWMKTYDMQNACLIFCGDIGLGFNSEAYYQQTFQKLNRECKKRNVTLLFVRGNHDDPSYFTEQKIRFSHIQSVPDYTIVSVAGHTVLCVGGGISMDRQYRLQRMMVEAQKYARFHGCLLAEAKELAPHLYWADEPPSFNEEALLEIYEASIQIDTVCTHTCPSFAEPRTKDGIESWLAQDADLARDIDNERAVMDQLYQHLISHGHPLQTWCYGHFHFHHAEQIDTTTFRLLDMCRRNGIYDMWEIR